MTQGTPWKRIVEFTIPMLIGNVAQQLYNTADSIIVGRYIGDNALAAVGSASPILNLLLVLFVGISVGAGIMVSQYYGAKDRANLSRAIGNCITHTAISSLVIMIIGPLVSKPLLILLNTPPSILNWCADYLNLFFLGSAGFAFYNNLAGILRGLGDSFSALVFLLIATALNVGLDLLFVAGMGVPGVALATVIAQGISALLCLLKLLKMKEHFDLNWSSLKPTKIHTAALFKLGIPSGLTQAIFSLAMIIVQSLTNSFGEMVIACNVIVMRVDGFAMMPNFSFGAAMTTFTKLYPHIKINYVNVELGDSSTQIALDGPAGVGPDLFAAPHDKLGELVSGGHVLPTAEAETIGMGVLETCRTALTYDGVMYGYPVSAETYALFYNKAYVKDNEVPATWEELKKFAAAFNKANPGKYGFIMDVGNAYYTIIFTTSKGNRLFGPGGTDTTNTNINSPASVEGMKFFRSLREILDVPAADLTTSICDSVFASGGAALYITGLWNVQNFENAGLKFGVAPLPALPGNNTPVASFSGVRAMFVSAYTNHQEEAELFAKFLMTEEMQRLRFEITGTLPAMPMEVKSPYLDGFLKQLEYAFPMPSIPQMGAYWDAMNAASANIWDGADIQAELDACNAAILR